MTPSPQTTQTVAAPDAPPQANDSSSELAAFLASAGLEQVTYQKVAVFPRVDFDLANNDSKKAFLRAANAACVGLFREDESGWVQKDHTTRLLEAKAALPRFAPHYRPTKRPRTTLALVEEVADGGHKRPPNKYTKGALRRELMDVEVEVLTLKRTVDIKVCTVLPSLLFAPCSLSSSAHLTPFPSLTLFFLRFTFLFALFEFLFVRIRVHENVVFFSSYFLSYLFESELTKTARARKLGLVLKFYDKKRLAFFSCSKNRSTTCNKTTITTRLPR